VTVNAATLNTLFNNKLDSAAGREKLAAAGASYIRERLRETSFFRKILPPEQVTKADCQRSVSHEGLTKIVDIEPQSAAMAILVLGSSCPSTPSLRSGSRRASKSCRATRCPSRR
jgi:hypothetical protein